MPPSTNNEIRKEKERILRFYALKNGVCTYDDIESNLNSLLLAVDKVNQGMKKPEQLNFHTRDILMKSSSQLQEIENTGGNRHADALSEVIKSAI